MMDMELLAQQQHQNELIKQAAQDRLAREIMQDEDHYIPTLAWLGERMIDIGRGLIAMTGRRENDFSRN
jgi:hypothetical protein